MWLDVAEFVTQRTIPMITKPFNLDKLLLMVAVAAARLYGPRRVHTIQRLSTTAFTCSLIGTSCAELALRVCIHRNAGRRPVHNRCELRPGEADRRVHTGAVQTVGL
jgi:hypothetical protein